ncbi:hypothetical protein Tco_1331730 [Tanacetum coccineum]
MDQEGENEIRNELEECLGKEIVWEQEPVVIDQEISPQISLNAFTGVYNYQTMRVIAKKLENAAADALSRLPNTAELLITRWTLTNASHFKKTECSSLLEEDGPRTRSFFSRRETFELREVKERELPLNRQKDSEHVWSKYILSLPRAIFRLTRISVLHISANEEGSQRIFTTSRYVVPTSKDNVIVNPGRAKVIPAGTTILVLVVLCLLRVDSIVS